MSNFLEKLKPIQIPDDETVKKQFISTYSKIHGVDEDDAIAFHLKEAIYLKQAILDEKSGIDKCTPMSIYSAFMECAILGLSAQKCARAEAYYNKTAVNRGTKDNSKWESICVLQIQAHGELTLRQRSGQIKHAFNPIVVYENDVFQPETNDKGELIITYKPQIPRTTNKIKACYIRLSLPSGLFDYKWLTIEDIERLRKSSAKFLKNDSGNNLYSNGEDGQIDVGFLETKTIKHAFKSYPKLKINTTAIFEDEEIVEPQQSFVEPAEVVEAQQTTEKVDDDGVF